MGCVSIDPLPSSLKLSIEQNNIRELITLNQTIASNSNSCLLNGTEINGSLLIFIRFNLTKQRSMDRVKKRLSTLYDLQPKLTHLLPYLYIGSNPHYYYTATKNPGHETLQEALVNGHFEVSEFNLCFGLSGIIQTLARMHDEGVCHGQIIPEKIIVHDNVCYLIDPCIGLEIVNELVEECQYFVAPEVLNGEIPSPASDVWSLGALIYYLVTGHTVYAKAPISEYVNIVVANNPTFTEPVWQKISLEFVTIVKKMLKKCEHRISLRKIINSNWFNKTGLTNTEKLTISNNLLLDDISSQLIIRDTVNLLANEMSKQKLQDLLRELQSIDYIKTGKVGLRFLLEKVLDSGHKYFDKLKKENLQVNYRIFIQAVIHLNELIIPERMAAIFYKYSKNEKWLESKDLKTIMAKFGMSVLDNIIFEQEVKLAQNSPRNKPNLTYEEFCKFFEGKRYNIPEEIIFM